MLLSLFLGCHGGAQAPQDSPPEVELSADIFSFLKEVVLRRGVDGDLHFGALVETSSATYESAVIYEDWIAGRSTDDGATWARRSRKSERFFIIAAAYARLRGGRGFAPRPGTVAR
jgi:hypothetical protein